MGDKPSSVSLVTIELEPVAGGTRFVFNERGAYFDDPDAVKNRGEGSRGLLDALAAELGR
jgi:uncharacterized protein YndB with AHSA1/START domain